MRITWSERTLATCLVVPVVIVVVLLTTVQYRWSAQLNSATNTRLADSLQMAMMGWQMDLYRTLVDVCLRLPLQSRQVGHQDLERTVRRFIEQQAASDHAALVKGVMLIPSVRPWPATRFNATTGHFEAETLDSSLEDLRRQLSVAPGRALQEGFTAASLSGVRDWRFAPTAAALARPVSASSSLFGADGRDGEAVPAWLVLTLSREALGDEVLPSLARRYFSGMDGLDYQVAVFAGHSRRLLYASEAGFADEPVPDADGRINIFGRMLDNSPSAVFVFHIPGKDSSPPISVSAPWFPLLGDASPDDDWLLEVRHRRDGALGALATRTRQRDLAISVTLLLLLLITMSLWLFVVHRAQRLADLQMNFVAAVSHDMRTPLTAIVSAADNISHGVVREGPQLTQYATMIGRQARKLGDLVEQTLQFAASRVSTPSYSPQSVDIATAIEAALEATMDLVETTGTTVVCDVERELPAVTGDPVGVLQCLQNLIANAIKYGGERRRVWIRAERVVREGTAEISVSVRDEGVGIAAAELPKIFAPFYRSPAVADSIRGTGLGLAVARSVAESMQGRLTVVSTLGSGTTMTLHIPIA